jgi:hypothetical protein
VSQHTSSEVTTANIFSPFHCSHCTIEAESKILAVVYIWMQKRGLWSVESRWYLENFTIRRIGRDGHFHIPMLGAFLSNSSGLPTIFGLLAEHCRIDPGTATIGELEFVPLDSFRVSQQFIGRSLSRRGLAKRIVVVIDILCGWFGGAGRGPMEWSQRELQT